MLEPAWSTVLFALVAANVDTAVRVQSIRHVTKSSALLINEVVGTIAVVVIVVLPWVLGGIDPSREDLTLAILVPFAAASSASGRC